MLLAVTPLTLVLGPIRVLEHAVSSRKNNPNTTLKHEHTGTTEAEPHKRLAHWLLCGGKGAQHDGRYTKHCLMARHPLKVCAFGDNCQSTAVNHEHVHGIPVCENNRDKDLCSFACWKNHPVPVD